MNDVTRLRLLAAFAVAAVVAHASAAPVAAQSTQVRSLPRFDRIELRLAADVHVEASRTPQRVRVSASGDDLAHVRTTVAGTTLVVAYDGEDDRHGRRIRLDIDVPALVALSARGAGDVTIAGLAGPAVALEEIGAGNVTASGRVRRVVVSLVGVGNIDTAKLRARSATVRASGTGDVVVFASDDLTATASGVGSIRYLGHPAHVTPRSTGVTTIAPM